MPECNCPDDRSDVQRLSDDLRRVNAAREEREAREVAAREERSGAS